jgi:hypothetical protein
MPEAGHVPELVEDLIDGTPRRLFRIRREPVEAGIEAGQRHDGGRPSLARAPEHEREDRDSHVERRHAHEHDVGRGPSLQVPQQRVGVQLLAVRQPRPARLRKHRIDPTWDRDTPAHPGCQVLGSGDGKRPDRKQVERAGRPRRWASSHTPVS